METPISGRERCGACESLHPKYKYMKEAFKDAIKELEHEKELKEKREYEENTYYCSTCDMRHYNNEWL